MASEDVTVVPPRAGRREWIGLAVIAREAFTKGLHLAAAISTVGSVGLAILVVTLLRRARIGGESHDRPDVKPVAVDGRSDAATAEW
jgi:hypothetical protein